MTCEEEEVSMKLSKEQLQAANVMQSERRTWYYYVLGEVLTTEMEYCCSQEPLLHNKIQSWVSYLRNVSSDYDEGGMKGKEKITEGHKTPEKPNLLYIVNHEIWLW